MGFFLQSEVSLDVRRDRASRPTLRIRRGLSLVRATGNRGIVWPGGRNELLRGRTFPLPQSAFGVASGEEFGFLCWYFSLRMDSFQIALTCSSEAVNGLSVPRDLRYSSFVIFDILHLETGGAILAESRLEPSSEPRLTWSASIGESRPQVRDSSLISCARACRLHRSPFRAPFIPVERMLFEGVPSPKK